VYDETIPHFLRMLTNLSSWLDQAQTYADERGFDADRLVVARLSPDQFELARQIQSATDTAKFCATRLSGETPPNWADDETTLAALRERVATAIAYLETVTPEQLAEGATAKVSPGFLQGAWFHGVDYVRGFALPNFYFHVTTAYSILRANGVPLGKRTFIGQVPVQPPE
jgi:hypothetical protein